MTNPNDSAFPSKQEETASLTFADEPGLTKLELFTAMALCSMIGKPEYEKLTAGDRALCALSAAHEIVDVLNQKPE